jgi:integrase
MMDKPISFYAFEMLYWCGIRLGELLALTTDDFDFVKSTVTISKSYQRIDREDIITEPKIPKSNRTIQMPDFLCQEMKEYVASLYGCKPPTACFPLQKAIFTMRWTEGARRRGLSVFEFMIRVTAMFLF